MPSKLRTFFFISLTIVTGILIVIITSLFIHFIIIHSYKSFMHKSLNGEQRSADKELYSFMLTIFIVTLLVFITISFKPINSRLYAYRNRLGFIEISSPSNLYNQTGLVSKIFNNNTKTTVNSYNFNQLKEYRLVPYNYKYRIQQKKLINRINIKLKERKYRLDDIE